MTIDEAIENLKEDIEIDMYIHDIAPQLAEWLEELKQLRNDKQIIHAPNCGLFVPLEEVKAMQMNFAMERQRLLEEIEQLKENKNDSN